MWTLNKTFLNNQWVKKEIAREIGKYFEMKRNEATTYPNIWDLAKLVFRDKCVVTMPALKRRKIPH